jgi:hypothetical protein
MTTISLRFAMHLGDPFSTDAQGPLFFRWLPRENSAITLAPSSQVSLKLWIERPRERYRGHEDHPLSVTADTKVWGKVEGGSLKGVLLHSSVPNDVLQAITRKKTGDRSYIEFGKSIVKDVLEPQLSRFIKILRVNFGQYWLRDLPPWDSRTYTLGGYCQNILALEWSINDTDWDSFIPNEAQLTFHAGSFGGGRQYLNLISESDWGILKDLMLSEHTPSEASSLLAQAHALFDRGHHRHAFIEAVTALEIAISELIAKNLGTTPPKDVENFSRQSIKTQLVAVSATSGLLSSSELEITLKAISIRNEMVHDRMTYGAEKRNEFMGLLQVTNKIAGGTVFKFPSLDGGNLQMPVSEWEKLESGLTGRSSANT